MVSETSLSPQVLLERHQSLLEEVPLLVQLNESELLSLLECAEEMVFKGGEIVFCQGDSGDALFVVLSGEVAIERESDSGKPIELARLRKSDFFGEMAMIDIEPRSATARVRTPSSLLRFDITKMREVLSGQGKTELLVIVLTNLARTLSRRLRDTNARV